VSAARKFICWGCCATKKTEFNDPDWTVGVKLGRDRNGGYWLLDMVRARVNPGASGRPSASKQLCDVESGLTSTGLLLQRGCQGRGLL
jgi:phage terminase large subunit-like protein